MARGCREYSRIARNVARAAPRRFLYRLLTMVLFVAAGWTVAAQEPAGPFDPVSLHPEEIRVIQAALSLAHDYAGLLDGDWGRGSAQALQAYLSRKGIWRAPRNSDLGVLIAGFDREWRNGGWQILYMEEFGISVAHPFGLLRVEEGNEEYLSVSTPDRDLILRWIPGNNERTVEMHRWAVENHAGLPDELYRTYSDDRLITASLLSDGKLLYLRSEPVGAMSLTLLVQADPPQKHRAALIVASYNRGPQPGLAPGLYGRLARLTGYTPFPVEPEKPPPAIHAEVDPPRKPAPPGRSDAPGPNDVTSTGTGFFVNATDLVTAAHVVKGCRDLRLPDGTRLTVFARDTDADLAVLQSENRSRDWLAVNADARLRLGQTVAAVGYPFYHVSGGALTLTTGNISATGGGFSEDQWMMISAPVQPGNSGGPLLSANGDVVGVVVARASDDFFLKETGTLPQDMNFAVKLGVLREFLARSGVPMPEGTSGLAPIEEGLSERAQNAVHAILCY